MMESIKQYSVLMPLWYKEKTEYLAASLESMLSQTVPPVEIAMITEHKLTKETEELLDSLRKRNPEVSLLVVLNESLAEKGLGTILAYGVTACHCDIIARMDTDDISFPNRCEKELEILMKHPDITIVGGGLQKFTDNPEQADGYRIPPEKGKQLRQYSKFRNPFNHPTVMFRKEAILKVGNYSPIKECEDYELWYRVLKSGYQGYNIQEPVLYYRAGMDMLKRRKNKTFYLQSLELVKRMRSDCYINWMEALLATTMQRMRFYFPFALNRFVYKHVRS